jgi:uncharacterized membrane protein YkvA (DUF1232 family)
MLVRLKGWARGIKRDVVTVYFAARDPQAPWLPRLMALLVAAYALSPIDLIPDFIPILGYVDDLFIVPLGVMLVMRWMPVAVLTPARLRAEALLDKPRSMWAAACFVLVWMLLGFFLVRDQLGKISS